MLGKYSPVGPSGSMVTVIIIPDVVDYIQF